MIKNHIDIDKDGSETHYVNDMIFYKIHLNNLIEFYWDNGNISSMGIAINGKPTGTWKTYDENGILKSKEYFT